MLVIPLSGTDPVSGAMDSSRAAWRDNDIAGCQVADERLTGRLGKLEGQVGRAMGHSNPFAGRDGASVEAAVCVRSDERVNEAAVRTGHFDPCASASVRYGAGPSWCDTMEFSDQREAGEAIGNVTSVKSSAWRINVAGMLRGGPVSTAEAGVAITPWPAKGMRSRSRDGPAFEVRGDNGDPAEALREIGHHKIPGPATHRKVEAVSPLVLAIIRAVAAATPQNRGKGELETGHRSAGGPGRAAVAKLESYETRRKMPLFHNILKPSCEPKSPGFGPCNT